MSKSLFISRDIEQDSVFLNLDLDVYAAAQIKVSFHKNFPRKPDFQWLFFSSKNCAKWAIDQKIDWDKFKVGAIGSPTAKYLQDLNVEVDFIGADQKTISEISDDFNDTVLDSERVLFPLSSISRKNILKEFSKSFDSIEAYQVEYDPILFDVTFDYLIFTSPSNFLSFFSANAISQNAIILAIGDSTKSEIEKYLNIPIFTPKEKTEIAIYELLEKLILDPDSLY